jgi:hypothetical protein
LDLFFSSAQADELAVDWSLTLKFGTPGWLSLNKVEGLTVILNGEKVIDNQPAMARAGATSLPSPTPRSRGQSIYRAITPVWRIAIFTWLR